jgi:predicted SnoaL-like aldol condensation-catalyzing enzyme
MASVKETALAFHQMAFVDRNPKGAREQFMGDVYIQHNPQVPDGPDVFVGAIEGFQSGFPDMTNEVKKIIVEDDLAALHIELHFVPGDRGMAVVDIFRVDDGKIVEHWDVVQEVPEESANNNTMW